MISTTRKKRGGLMLGMAGLIVVTATLTASILHRSQDSYQSAAQGCHRLQAQATLESAIVWLSVHQQTDRELVLLGNTAFILEQEERNSESKTRTISVAVLGKNELPVYERDATVTYVYTDDDGFQLRSVSWL